MLKSPRSCLFISVILSAIKLIFLNDGILGGILLLAIITIPLLSIKKIMGTTYQPEINKWGWVGIITTVIAFISFFTYHLTGPVSSHVTF